MTSSNGTIVSDALQSVLRETTVKHATSTHYDAVIVGAGAAGGLAALLLCEAGRKVLVLDAGYPRGFSVAPFSYMVAQGVRNIARPELFEFLPLRVSALGRKALKLIGRVRQPVQSRCFAWERDPSCLVDDRENPYECDPAGGFLWFRSRQLGGRMIVPGHGRQYFRLSAKDLQPGDGFSPHWPVTAEDIGPWYSLVERRLRLAGRSDGHPWVPDSEIAEELVPSPAERALKEHLEARWPDAAPILGRSAPPLPSLALAAQTGCLSCLQGAVVHEIIVNGSGAACGLKFVDDATLESHRIEAPLIFLCASALESTRILMLSRSPHRPEGIGGSSGALGRYLMDHIVISGYGTGPGLPGGGTGLEAGRSIYLPRFDQSHGDAGETQRGFGVQLYQIPKGANVSFFQGVSFSEMTPRPENHVSLNERRKDRWGVPTLRISCRHSEAELERARRQSQALQDIADAIGVELDAINTKPTPPGMAMHECGTARMGTSPEDSVLDPSNQCWDAKGLYVTDGACFPSQGTQNPTLTIMALTARACAHALRNH